MNIMDSDLLETFAMTKRFPVQSGNTIDLDDQKTIYVDLDDTICQFASHYESMFGVHPSKYKDDNDGFWKTFNKNPVDFFYNLKPFYGYLEFLAFCMRQASVYGYNVKFLTALSSYNNRTFDEQLEEKLNWVKKYVYEYGLIIPLGYVSCSSDKKEFADYGHILIDDLKSNVNEWREHRGTAIHHTSFQTSMVDLMAALEVLHEKRSIG